MRPPLLVGSIEINPTASLLRSFLLGARTYRPGAWLLCAALLLATVPRPASAADMKSLLQAAGISPVVPTPARDFTLPLVDSGSGEFTLSQQQGAWVLLTFFASWCGPCKQELPTLAALHSAQSAAGLSVVGVALEQDPSIVRRFIRRLGVNFVVVYDPTSKVGSAYKASAIPVSYLIDPNGNVVGVARGSRDWRGFARTFAQLVASEGKPLADAATTTKPGYTEGDAPLDLPPDFDPPSAKVKGPSSAVRPGVPFSLDVEVTWSGTLQDYVLLPPRLDVPEGIVLKSTSAKSSAALGHAVIQYRLWLEAAEIGEFRLSPVEVRYTPQGEEAPQVRRVTGPTVKVMDMPVFPMSWMLLAGGVLLLGGTLLIFTRQRHKKRSALNEVQNKELMARTKRERVHGCVQDAQQQRMRGNHQAMLKAMSAGFQAASALSAADYRAELGTVDEILQRGRFAGVAPKPEETDPLMRKLERAMREIDSSATEHEESKSL